MFSKLGPSSGGTYHFCICNIIAWNSYYSNKIGAVGSFIKSCHILTCVGATCDASRSVSICLMAVFISLSLEIRARMNQNES